MLWNTLRYIFLTALLKPTFYEGPQTWFRAQEICERDEGHLLSNNGFITQPTNLLNVINFQKYPSVWYGKQTSIVTDDWEGIFRCKCYFS